MKLFTPAVLCAASVLSLASAVHAQTTTTTGATGDPWSFSIGANGAYEGNPLFVSPEDQGEFSHSYAASLARNWTMRRGNAQLGASASQYFYRESTGLNDFRYNASGALTHAITRRLSWSGSSNISSGLARDAEVLVESGVVLPSVETRTSSSSSNFSYALSRRSQLGWSVVQTGVGFSSGLFQGGSTLGSVLSWTRTVGRSQSLGVTYDYSLQFIDDLRTTVQGVLGTWSGTVGTWTAHASGGVRPYTVAESSVYRFAPALSTGLTKPLSPGQAIGINYERTVTPTFGLETGNRLVQSVGGNYSIALARTLSTSFSGSFSRGSDPVTPDLQSTGRTAAASLAYRATPRLSVTLATSLYSYTYSARERVTSYNMTTGLTYGFTWR